MSRIETEILTSLYQIEISNYIKMAGPRSSYWRITEDKITRRRKHLISRWVLDRGQLVCQWIVKN